MTNKKFDNLFNHSPRKPESQIKQFHMDLASSIQVVTEEIMIKILKNLKQEFSSKNLCLAGGVALNCVANGKTKKQRILSLDSTCCWNAGAVIAPSYSGIYLNKKRQIKMKIL